MEVTVVTEHRFEQTPDGRVWTYGQQAYSFWTRYLGLFDTVRVVARVRQVPDLPGDVRQADGPGVVFWGLPAYQGPLQLLAALPSLRARLREAAAADDAVLLRVPSALGALFLRGHRRPYGVEVISDPHAVFAPGAVHHPLRPLLRPLATRHLERVVRSACAVSYVTADALQRRYPAAESACVFACSDVELPLAALAAGPRSYHSHRGRYRLVTVGSLAQLYKAPDVLIDAVARCVRQGLDLELSFVGDGRYRPSLEAQARAAGLADRCRFLGQLPSGEPVRAQLDQADLFVLPSRTEGLPRALVEAMARALPCIGSNVGGIPELLPTEALVPPADAPALAARIAAVITDRTWLQRMSARNLAVAERYQEPLLRERRNQFYACLAVKTTQFRYERGLMR